MSDAALVPSGTSQIIDVSVLRRGLFAKRLPRGETDGRIYAGRALDMRRLEAALLMADSGLMVELTDLEGESISLDPHILSVAGKRFGALAACPWAVTPAKGPDVDKLLAREIADVVRGHLSGLVGFGEAIYDLAWSLFDGRGALEVRWDYVGGRRPWRPAELGWIHPRRLSFGRERELRVVDTSSPGSFWAPGGHALRDFPGKFLTWCPRLFREYPEREGLGPRSLYWTYFKRFSARMRMILTELFAVPWRIVEWDKDVPLNHTDIDEAVDAAEALGETTVANVGPGGRIKVEFPPERSGQLFALTIEDVDKQMSKLYLGNEATTEQGSFGLGSNAPSVAKGEQNIFLARDGMSLSSRVRQLLVIVDVLLNYGPSALDHAPGFEILTAPQKDRAAELSRMKESVLLDVPVAVADWYEGTGLRPPEEDEAVLRLGEPSTLGGAPRAIIRDPARERAEADARRAATPDPAPAQADDEGGAGLVLAPTDVAVIVKVNEGRRSQGLGPLLLPDGRPDPDGYLTIAAFKAKHAAVVAAAAQAESGDAGGDEGGVEPAGAPDGTAELARHDRRVCLASPQPRFANGSPEDIIERAVREGARLTGAVAEELAAAVDGEDEPTRIHARLSAAAKGAALDRLASALERSIVRGLMLGAMDAAWEPEADQPVRVAVFSPGREGVLLAGFGAGVADFATKPFAEALRAFLSKKVIPRRAFDRLRAEAKRRAFTVAGLARDDMLKAAHDELGKAIEGGDDLRDFARSLRERMQSRGWTALAPSHVEVVFRNGVMGAYSSGRHAQMTQPAVLEARPFWQVMGVRDDRTRAAHRAAHGKVLRADDDFWKRAPLPWGHNCRDRVVSRSQADLTRLGLSVTSGASLKNLPDEGWDAGPSLLR